MAARPRKVYFMEPVRESADGSVAPFESGFWPTFHKHVANAPASVRFITFGGTRYGGSARTSGSPATDYVYLGLRRRRSDFPDYAEDETADEHELDVPGLLVEPMYALEVTGTNYAAFMRTAAGPTFTAFERWMTKVLGYEGTDESVLLRPYVRADAMQRLVDADGVAKLDLKFDPDSLRAGAQDGGTIEGALKQIQDIGGGGVTVDLQVSFGRARPSEAGAENYAHELQQILGSRGLRRATATLLTAHRSRNDAGQENVSFAREQVDFLRDQVVHRVKLDQDDTVRRTPQLVLQAMGSAISEFRRDLQQPQRS